MTRGGTYTEAVARDELPLEAVGIVRDGELAYTGGGQAAVRWTKNESLKGARTYAVFPRGPDLRISSASLQLPLPNCTDRPDLPFVLTGWIGHWMVAALMGSSRG